jgi:hypothetical protein
MKFATECSFHTHDVTLKLYALSLVKCTRFWAHLTVQVSNFLLGRKLRLLFGNWSRGCHRSADSCRGVSACRTLRGSVQLRRKVLHAAYLQSDRGLQVTYKC